MPITVTRQHRNLEDQIRLWVRNVIDFDILVDDARAVRARAEAEERDAVRRRNAAARHLMHLIAWADDRTGPLPEAPEC